MAFVNDSIKHTGKPMVYIDVPHVTYIGESPMGTHRVNPEKLPSKGDYGAFLKGVPLPVVHLGDLTWFGRKENENSFQICVKYVRWSKNKYPLIELTLPKAIELAYALGAKHINPPKDILDDDNYEEDVMDENSENFVVPSINYDAMTVVELRSLAKAKNVKNYSKMRKEELIKIIK